MKVAVYTIALNEKKHVKGWAESAGAADLLYVGDTGSSDGTVGLCQKNGIICPIVTVRPWRFDDARNAVLSLIPDWIDYCVVLDMDERLAPGWREELERCAGLGATRLRYRYVWSHNDDGSDGLQFYRDGLHSRFGYRWVHPVHEVLQPDRITEKLVESTITVHHYPDSMKSRGQYLPLLAQSVKERPDDDRNAHYYARELFFNGRMEEAAKEFKRHLALPTARWAAERAASMRYLAKIEKENAESWLLDAAIEDPARREALVELAGLYYERKDWSRSLRYAVDAIAIKNRPLDYLCDGFAWGALPHDYAAIASYNLGWYERAVGHGATALGIEPDNERMINNQKFYIAASEALDKDNGGR
jgi:tetratricopeptide (TPR) repeat protein